MGCESLALSYPGEREGLSCKSLALSYPGKREGLSCKSLALSYPVKERDKVVSLSSILSCEREGLGCES